VPFLIVPADIFEQPQQRLFVGVQFAFVVEPDAGQVDVVEVRFAVAQARRNLRPRPRLTGSCIGQAKASLERYRAEDGNPFHEHLPPFGMIADVLLQDLT